MRKIKIRHLRAENFKGFTAQEIDFTDTTVVSGKNATGKTSLIDAFMWLLFGKDSQGRSDFQIRPVDENGKMIDNTEIKVEAVLEDDSVLYTHPQTITLTKVQKQKWVKKRGADCPTFSGNENRFMVNNFPVSQREYDGKVASLVDERLFRLLTNPMTFASMKWQDQREILLLLVPEITDEDILNAYPNTFAAIEEDIRAAGVDKTREKEAFSLKKLKEDQKTYPTRIDEAMRSIVDVDVEGLTAIKEEEEGKLAEIRQKKADLEASLKEVSEVQNQILDVKVRMTEIERTEREKVMHGRYASQKAYEDAKQAVRVLTDQFNRTKSALDIAESALELNKEDMEKAKAEYMAVKAKTLPEDQTVCPTCQRPFQAEKIAEIRMNFKDAKDKELSIINMRGKRLRKAIDEAIPGIERMKADCEKLKADISIKMAEADALKTVFETAPASADMDACEAYQEAQKQMSELQARLSTMSDGKARKQALEESEKDVLETIKGIDSQLAIVEANERASRRVKELQEEQLECSQSVASQEHILCLIEDFMKKKMDLLSERINGKFKYVRFKLFETLINGVVNPTCVMQIASNGSYVDYKDANHAAQIIGGLDVINALSEMYGITAPVWIDNAEALDSSNTPETESQLILLKVTDDPELTITEGR